MAKPNTERVDPLAAVGLSKKPQTLSEPEMERRAETAISVPTSVAALPAILTQERKSEEERATEKVTAYFTPPQYDHIDELRRQYRKRTKQRISVNALLRRLVERANIEDILPTE
ncbi:MAG: hypothetical protein ACRDHZ_00315 [Ktedonobacteraceae bacterium]